MLPIEEWEHYYLSITILWKQTHYGIITDHASVADIIARLRKASASAFVFCTVMEIDEDTFEALEAINKKSENIYVITGA